MPKDAHGSKGAFSRNASKRSVPGEVQFGTKCSRAGAGRTGSHAAIDTIGTVQTRMTRYTRSRLRSAGCVRTSKRILAKIGEQNADANERQLQRGLVISVKDQPELLPVAEMVVDGDGAGASPRSPKCPRQ